MTNQFAGHSHCFVISSHLSKFITVITMYIKYTFTVNNHISHMSTLDIGASLGHFLLRIFFRQAGQKGEELLSLTMHSIIYITSHDKM